MKFFIAELLTETNTFATAPTGLGGFEEFGIYRGNASSAAAQGCGALLAHIRRLMEDDGHEVAESLCALAQPSGKTLKPVYESFREQILSDLRAAMPVDAVQLVLHGAMVAQGYDDCEGDLLAAIRAVVGADVPVGAELDLHCHLTTRMLGSADLLVAFKEYPHTDGEARARELFLLLRDTAARRLKPCTAVHDCKMVGLWHTTSEPMAGFVRRMQALEGRDGVLSISLGHGFPWGDVPEAGAKLWVITDGDAGLAASLAQSLGQEFWALREQTRPDVMPLPAALDHALAHAGGPVVLADVADNPGGGAPGDSTFVLQQLLARQISRAVIGTFWDLGAVHICQEAGVGAELDLRIGGKCGPSSGQPVDLRVTVRAVIQQHSQSALGMRAALGTSVWLETANELHIVLASVRSQVFGTDAFTGLGIPLHDKRLIVVKSTQHFHAEFAPLADAVLYATTPGALDFDFGAIPYRHRDLNFWPRLPDPHCPRTAAPSPQVHLTHHLDQTMPPC